MVENDKVRFVKESVEWYIKQQDLYKQLGQKVEYILKELIELKGITYHIIYSRVKDINSFSTKLLKKDYKNPEWEVTDLAGIRVIAYVESQVEAICSIIKDNFNIDKVNSIDKSYELGVDKVGYKSVHFVASLSGERLMLPEYIRFESKYFEIQVRTILQHAWAEIEHDRNYKFSGRLPMDIQRRFKLLAGMLESADREFNGISNEIDRISEEVDIATKRGDLDISINSTSLRHYLTNKFGKLIEHKLNPTFSSSSKEIEIIIQLEKFGIKSLKDLDSIIPKDFIKKYVDIALPHDTDFYSLLVDVMLTNDSKKYFKSVYEKSFWHYYGEYTLRFLKTYDSSIEETLRENEIEIVYG